MKFHSSLGEFFPVYVGYRLQRPIKFLKMWKKLYKKNFELNISKPIDFSKNLKKINKEFSF